MHIFMDLRRTQAKFQKYNNCTNSSQISYMPGVYFDHIHLLLPTHFLSLILNTQLHYLVFVFCFVFRLSNPLSPICAAHESGTNPWDMVHLLPLQP